MTTPKLANYSTTVEAGKTVSEIQYMLSTHGAKSIMVDYKDGEPIGLAFLIITTKGEVAFRLPAHVDKVAHVFASQRTQSRYRFNAQQKDEKQASRVAWRILRDWVRAQLAIIETEMVTLDEVFLPYMRVGDSQKSLYEVVQEKYYLSEGTKSPER